MIVVENKNGATDLDGLHAAVLRSDCHQLDVLDASEPVSGARSGQYMATGHKESDVPHTPDQGFRFKLIQEPARVHSATVGKIAGGS